MAPAKQHKGGLIAIGTLVLLLALAAAYGVYRFFAKPEAPAAQPKVTQVSHWNKSIENAHLSPDGRTIAFTSPAGSVPQVFVMLSSGGEPLQLTRDEGEKIVCGFSADGSEIYFSRVLGGDEVWAIPTLGGTARRLVPGGCAAPSPDGTTLFYGKSFDRGVYRANSAGLAEERIYSFEGTPLYPADLLPFPDAKDVLVSAARTFGDTELQLYKVNLDSHKAQDLGTVSGGATGAVWLEPGEKVLFSRTVNGVTNLWAYSLTDRTLAQFTFGPGPDLQPMPYAGGKGILFVNGRGSGFLSVYHTRSKMSADLVAENATQPILSPDGKRVQYVKVLDQNRNELWVSDIDDNNSLKLASSSASLVAGSWCPDGTQVLFADGLGGESKAFIVGADGRGLREIHGTEGELD